MTPHIILLPWSLYTDPWDTSCLKTTILTEEAWGKLQTCLWVVQTLTSTCSECAGEADLLFYWLNVTCAAVVTAALSLVLLCHAVGEQPRQEWQQLLETQLCGRLMVHLLRFLSGSNGNLLFAEPTKSVLCILTFRSPYNFSLSADCQIVLLLTHL